MLDQAHKLRAMSLHAIISCHSYTSCTGHQSIYFISWSTVWAYRDALTWWACPQKNPLDCLYPVGRRLGPSAWCQENSCSECSSSTQYCIPHIYQNSNHILHHFSADKHPTLYYALPALKKLQSVWEDKLKDSCYELYHDALRDGLAKIKKYYCKFDEKLAHIISLSTCFHCNLYLILMCHSNTSSVLQVGLYQNRVGRGRGTSCRICKGKC
jgi:hypothetical protein